MKKLILLLSAVCFFSCATYAQVTIGSGIEPMKGALLDLKENAADPVDNTTAKLGILLPRVRLNNPKPAAVAGTDGLAASIDGNDPAESWDLQHHIGLTVYNLTDDGIFCPGVYVWLGDVWERLPEPCIPRIIKANGAVVCGGPSTVVLTAEASTGAVIRWYDAATGGTLLQTSTTENDTYTISGLAATTSYWVEAYNSSINNINPRTEVVATVGVIPATPSSPVDAEVCPNSPATISATPPTNCTIDWYDGTNTLVQAGTDASTTSLTIPSLVSSSTYYARARNIDTGCESNSLLAVLANTLTARSQPVSSTPTYSGSGSYAKLEAYPNAGVTVSWYEGTTLLGTGNTINVLYACENTRHIRVEYSMESVCPGSANEIEHISLPAIVKNKIGNTKWTISLNSSRTIITINVVSRNDWMAPHYTGGYSSSPFVILTPEGISVTWTVRVSDIPRNYDPGHYPSPYWYDWWTPGIEIRYAGCLARILELQWLDGIESAARGVAVIVRTETGTMLRNDIIDRGSGGGSITITL